MNFRSLNQFKLILDMEKGNENSKRATGQKRPGGLVRSGEPAWPARAQAPLGRPSLRS
jgi:hypothetical protein